MWSMKGMSLRNLTWQQVVVCLALLASVVGAYELFGDLPAGVLVVVSAVVNLLLGRDPPNDQRPLPVSLPAKSTIVRR